MPHALKPMDPITATVERHRAAYLGWQDAPEAGEAADSANAEYGAATAALLVAPCETRSGAEALRGHLEWWLAIEAEFAAEIQPTYAIAEARAADLALFLGRGAPRVIPSGLSTMGLPPVRRALNLRRAVRSIPVMTEGLAALAIIAGGIVATGFASIL